MREVWASNPEQINFTTPLLSTTHHHCDFVVCPLAQGRGDGQLGTAHS